eukprot:747684-Hanusia_phi.AAC.2
MQCREKHKGRWEWVGRSKGGMQEGVGRDEERGAWGERTSGRSSCFLGVVERQLPPQVTYTPVFLVLNREVIGGVGTLCDFTPVSVTWAGRDTNGIPGRKAWDMGVFPSRKPGVVKKIHFHPGVGVVIRSKPILLGVGSERGMDDSQLCLL